MGGTRVELGRIDPNAGTAGDNLYNNVELLTHFEGSHNATNSIDSSIRAHALSFNGNAKISTGVYKFGSSSLVLDGTGDFVKASDNLQSFDFGTSNFCVEGWAYFPDTGSNQTVFSNYDWALQRNVETTAGATNYWDTNTIAAYDCSTWLYDLFANNGMNNGVAIPISLNQGDSLELKLTKSDGSNMGAGLFGEAQVDYDGNWSDDSSSSNHTVTPVNDANLSATQHHDAKFVGSVYFDGTADYLTIPNNDVFDLSGPETYTIEFWYKWVSNSSAGDDNPDNSGAVHSLEEDAILTKGRYNHNAYGKGWGFSVSENMDAGKMRFQLQGGSTSYERKLVSTTTVTDGSWHHIAVTKWVDPSTQYEADNTWKLYINGTKEAEFTEGGAAGTFDNEYDVLVGAGQVYSYSASDSAHGNRIGHYSNCYINELRISRDVNSAAAAIRYTADFTPPSSPFVNDQYTALLCHFNPTSAILTNSYGTTWDNDYKCTEKSQMIFNYQNSTWYAPATATFKINRITMRTILDSCNMSMAHLCDYTNFKLRLEAYVNGQKVGGEATTTPKLRFSYNDGSAIQDIDYNGWGISSNSWYHLAAVRNDTSLELFIDGQRVKTATVSANQSIGNATLPLHIGAAVSSNGSSTSGYFEGYLDDLRVTKGYARYTETFTKPTSTWPSIAGLNLQQVITNTEGTQLVLGTAGLETKQLASAWAHFDGTTTPISIKDSYNVNSITDVSVGKYDINFKANMNDVNYAPLTNVGRASNQTATTAHENIDQRSVSGCRVETLNNGTNVDASGVSILIFGGK